MCRASLRPPTTIARTTTPAIGGSARSCKFQERHAIEARHKRASVVLRGQFLRGSIRAKQDRPSMADFQQRPLRKRIMIMCAIFGMFDLQPGDDLASLRRQALELSQRQRHRGPDWSGVFVDDKVILVHERLAIVDPASGAQPLRSRDGALALAVNGELYNHGELRLGSGYDFTTGSDCEVINALYREAGDPADWLARLNGIFAFALWRSE